MIDRRKAPTNGSKLNKLQNISFQSTQMYQITQNNKKRTVLPITLQVRGMIIFMCTNKNFKKEGKRVLKKSVKILLNAKKYFCFK